MKQPIETVKCELCGVDTRFTGTRRCTFCWELEWRVKHAPLTALKVLIDNNLIPKKLKSDN